MKILTTSFLTCAVKTCKSSPLSFPLHYQDAELSKTPIAYNPQFLVNILPRVDWDAVKVTATELGFTLPDSKPEPTLPTPPNTSAEPTSSDDPISSDDATPDSDTDVVDATAGQEVGEDDKVLRELHTLLLETEVKEGKLVCGNCGHEYRIKEGIANFLLPSHLV